MGLKLSEVLKSRFFEESRVISGEEGLDRVVQGVSSQDAPTGGEWARGKELILSTGYFFKDNTEYLREVIIEAHKKNSAGMGIKLGRYIDTLPVEIIELSNELKFPIINLPSQASWMEIANSLNSLVLDRHLDRLAKSIEVYGNKNYNKKIYHLILGLHEDIGNHVELYDFYQGKIFSSRGKTGVSDDPLDYKDIWNVDFDYYPEVLSDTIGMKKIMYKDKVSRIIVPIKIDDIILANLVIWEDIGDTDYFDLYTIRLSLLFLYKEYGNIYFDNTLNDEYLDERISQILYMDYQDVSGIVNKTLNKDSKYMSMSIKGLGDIDLYSHRNYIYRIIYSYLDRDRLDIGIVNKGEIGIIYRDDRDDSQELQLGKIYFGLLNIVDKLGEIDNGVKFVSAMSSGFVDVKTLKENYRESLNTIDIASFIYPDKSVVRYDDLGPFNMFSAEKFKDDNKVTYKKYIQPILEEEDGYELLQTLKIFLDSNQSYTETAEKLYIHNNTARYRINKIKDIIDIDREDNIERLKLEIMLTFIDIF